MLLYSKIKLTTYEVKLILRTKKKKANEFLYPFKIKRRRNKRENLLSYRN